MCSECGWQERCDTEWEAADHLHRVANIRSSQIASLREAGVSTLAALAALPEGMDTPAVGLLRAPVDAADDHVQKAVKAAAQAIARHLAPLPRPRAA